MKEYRVHPSAARSFFAVEYFVDGKYCGDVAYFWRLGNFDAEENARLFVNLLMEKELKK